MTNIRTEMSLQTATTLAAEIRSSRELQTNDFETSVTGVYVIHVHFLKASELVVQAKTRH
jgi:hypothetical protein